jgi:hypothetical protein
MWRVVCLGPGPHDAPRRNLDRGPLVASEARARAIADWLRATRLYERVDVERATFAPAQAAPD